MIIYEPSVIRYLSTIRSRNVQFFNRGSPRCGIAKSQRVASYVLKPQQFNQIGHSSAIHFDQPIIQTLQLIEYIYSHLIITHQELTSFYQSSRTFEAIYSSRIPDQQFILQFAFLNYFQQHLFRVPFSITFKPQSIRPLMLHSINKWCILIINQLMPGEGEKSRSYHSEDKRRSLSKEEARQLKLERVKQRFKNITTRIRQIKQENSSDLTQLGSLMRGSEEIEKMANQSLEKATLFLSESKLHAKRLASPPFHQSKHAPQEFILSPSEPPAAIPKRKGKSGKRAAAAAHIKTDETSESEALKDCTNEQISEISLHQEQSGVRQQKHQNNPTPIPAQPQAVKRQTVESEAKEFRMLRQSGSNSSLLKAGSRNASTQGSMRASLRRSLHPPQGSRSRGESIFPYIAIILFSIVFLLWLRA